MLDINIWNHIFTNPMFHTLSSACSWRSGALVVLVPQGGPISRQ